MELIMFAVGRKVIQRYTQGSVRSHDGRAYRPPPLHQYMHQTNMHSCTYTLLVVMTAAMNTHTIYAPPVPILVRTLDRLPSIYY